MAKQELEKAQNRQQTSQIMTWIDNPMPLHPVAPCLPKRSLWPVGWLWLRVASKMALLDGNDQWS
jgi:hypothetical protein